MSKIELLTNILPKDLAKIVDDYAAKDYKDQKRNVISQLERCIINTIQSIYWISAQNRPDDFEFCTGSGHCGCEYGSFDFVDMRYHDKSCGLYCYDLHMNCINILMSTEEMFDDYISNIWQSIYEQREHITHAALSDILPPGFYKGDRGL